MRLARGVAELRAHEIGAADLAKVRLDAAGRKRDWRSGSRQSQPACNAGLTHDHPGDRSGTAMLGYGVVERTGTRLRAIDYGVIKTPPRLSLPERLEAIYLALTDLIDLHAPALVGVERLFFTKNVQTAFAVARPWRHPARSSAPLPRHSRGDANEVKVATAGHGSPRRTRWAEWSRQSWAWPKSRHPTMPPMRSRLPSAWRRANGRSAAFPSGRSIGRLCSPHPRVDAVRAGRPRCPAPGTPRSWPGAARHSCARSRTAS